MKIIQLKLLAFGPFTDVTLELGEGQKGLHVIYGPNEAGKSSALRALRQMLYGIPARSSDDFVHPYAKMRIGGTIRKSDGTVLEFIRRKGNVNTLRTPDDLAIVDESHLRMFLGGVDADLFATMFGIDHADLERGGKEIIQGGGDIGQILFAAGSGVSELRRVQDELQIEGEDLFKPTGHKPEINKAASMLREKHKALRGAQLPSQEWASHDDALSETLTQKESVERELEEKQREKNRLERINEALPTISRRKELLDELRAYADAVILPADFSERRLEALTDLRIAEQKEKEATENLEAIKRELVELVVPEQILEQADLIGEMYQDLGSHRKATKDRAGLVIQRDRLRAEASEFLKGLRDDITLDDADKLRIAKSENVRIQDLGGEYQRLITKLETAQDAIAKLSLRVDKLKGQIAALEKPRDVSDLRRAMQQTHQHGALEEQYKLECTEIRQARARVKNELNRQTLWAGTLEELQQLPIPGLESIDAFEQRLTEAEGLVSRQRSEIDDLERVVLEFDGQIEQLRLEQEVPTEEDLHEARSKRDEGWRLVRQTWGEGREAAEDVQEYVTGFPPASDLAEAYEQGTRLADELADRLRREADRVAKKATLFANRQTHENQLERLKNQLNAAEEQLTEIEDEWSALWGKIGITPRSPREMRAWAQNQGALVKEIDTLGDREAKAATIKALIEARRVELRLCLERLGEPSAETSETLADLLDRSQQMVDHIDKIHSDLERHAHDLEQRVGELQEAELEAKTLQGQLSRWRSEWEDAIEPLGLEAEARPAQANAVLQDLDELFVRQKEADGFHRRIQGIDKDAEEFTGKVQRLTERVAPDLVKLPADEAASELNARLTHARTMNTEYQSLEQRKMQEQEKLLSAKSSINEIHARLATMCEEAGCENYEELAVAEQRSTRRQEIDNKLEELEEHLRQLSAGATLEEFVQTAQTVDPDSIDPMLDRLIEEIEVLGRQRSELDQAIGSERTELSKMDGSATAAEMAEEVQGIVARLETDVEQYVRLRLASVILSQAIESYREKHQGPIMKRSSELFTHVTLGSFEGLRLEFDEKGDAVLVGVRPGGKEIVGVKGMSDGTTDQLYLSVRLASLETYLEKNEPIPFIVDDILIKFDDDRATATLQALAQLSQHTQVIFFTHHRRLVELAEGHVSKDVLHTHSLNL